MSKKHEKTLKAIFAHPTRANIVWKDIEALFQALGAEITEGKGSRVRIKLKGTSYVFHRPHPQKEADKGCVKDARELLELAGCSPED